MRTVVQDKTEINTNKTGETDLGNNRYGESYEGFEWPLTGIKTK